MLRLLLAWVVGFTSTLSAFGDETAELERARRELAERLLGGDSPEHFAKHIGPLIEGIGKAKTLALYEGLPHQTWEPDALARELKEKKTVKLHDFPFYAGAIVPAGKDAKALTAVCADGKTFRRWRGEKACGGFHPDWCIELRDGADAYQILVCFGCHEARLFGPKNEVFSDIDESAIKDLGAVLKPLRKNRPSRDPDK